jgi:hypothetical protein
VVIAAGLTALLLWQSDPKAVWQAARGADWRFIVLRARSSRSIVC